MKKSIFVAAAVLLFGSIGYCWGDMGHSLVGEIAEETIKPTTRDFVRGVLGVEPMSVAATWPDHVRDDKRFGHRDYNPATHDADNHDFSDYHFCEIPVGFDYKTKPNKDKKDCYGAITGAIDILKAPQDKYSREEKMIAMRYLIHVMGDIHQPLHVGNGMDRGGNTCDINWQKSATDPVKATNLHSFWDDTMVDMVGETIANPKTGKKAARYIPDYIKILRKSHDELFSADGKTTYGVGDLVQWLGEAQSLRESGVYPDATGAMDAVVKGEEYLHRDYCQWFDLKTGKAGNHIDKLKIPTIDATYIARFEPIVELQLIKGGLRLATVLDQIADAAAAAQPAAPIVDLNKQEEILSTVQDKFRGSSN